MAGNSFGEILKLSTFGESHGPAVGGILDGVPAGLTINADQIQWLLDQRKPGQSAVSSSRNESDKVEILSGIFQSKSLGTPIGFIIRNTDARPADYEHLQTAYRPSHADFAWDQKYGFRDFRGGGRASARETAARVAAGAIALQLLHHFGISVLSWVSKVGDVRMDPSATINSEAVFSNEIRCPHPASAASMRDLILKLKAEGNTIGGMVSTRVTGLNAGIGEPVFDKLHASLGHAMLSINAVKGFEYGSGFGAVKMTGSEHNDTFVNSGGSITTRTNHSGGIQGGISNGNEINFNVAFKPVATVLQPQETVNAAGEAAVLEGKGRHDPCVVPRAVPIVMAMTALTVADQLLRNRSARL